MAESTKKREAMSTDPAAMVALRGSVVRSQMNAWQEAAVYLGWAYSGVHAAPGERHHPQPRTLPSHTDTHTFTKSTALGEKSHA